MRVVKKPEERRAEMVAAASKLFAQQGFVRTLNYQNLAKINFASFDSSGS